MQKMETRLPENSASSLSAQRHGRSLGFGVMIQYSYLISIKFSNILL